MQPDDPDVLKIYLSIGYNIPSFVIVDLYNNKSMIWARRNLGTGLTHLSVIMGQGLHRFWIMVEMGANSRLAIRSVNIEKGEQGKLLQVLVFFMYSSTKCKAYFASHVSDIPEKYS